MKKLLTFLLVLLATFTLFSCNFTPKPITPKDFDNELNKVNYRYNKYTTALDEEFLVSYTNFASKMIKLADTNDNYSVSPLSIYLAFSILHHTAEEAVKIEIENFFEMNRSEIEYAKEVFSKLICENTDENGGLKYKLSLTNSVWFDESIEPNKTALESLAEQLYCHALYAPFQTKNQKANDLVREFVRQYTNGLIDRDFGLNDQVAFAIINTLYLYDTFDQDFSKYTDTFFMGETKKQVDFVRSLYVYGDIQETKTSMYFYVRAEHGTKLKLIVPKAGYTLDEVMNIENLNTINLDIDYHNSEKEVETRCLFPCFKINYSTPLKDILENNHYLTKAFNCYQTSLMDDSTYVSDIKHQVVLNVNEKGIEGAAVTIIANAKSAMPQAQQDFLVNQPFVYLVTTAQDVILFGGKVINL